MNTVPPADNQKEARISARVTPKIRNTLQQAADLTGSTLNQFLVQSALKEAEAVIERDRIIKLSQRDAELFFRLLDNPPAPNQALKDAVADYQATVDR
jgi:uncharacterized protein (DUF1778 family)